MSLLDYPPSISSDPPLTSCPQCGVSTDVEPDGFGMAIFPGKRHPFVCIDCMHVPLSARLTDMTTLMLMRGRFWVLLITGVGYVFGGR